MAINVTLGEVKPKEEKPFPKLMKSKNGRIVFFLEDEYGVQLNITDNNDSDLPHYSSNWDMGNFTDYNEPITLQNQ